jgi:acyl dehydratase
MPRLYWDTIELGDPVAPLQKPAVTRVHIAKFAGASQDWSPLHLDDDFAKSAGYGSVFAGRGRAALARERPGAAVDGNLPEARVAG